MAKKPNCNAKMENFMIIESANFLLFIYIHAPYILNKYCYTFLMIPFDTLIVNSFFKSCATH